MLRRVSISLALGLLLGPGFAQGAAPHARDERWCWKPPVAALPPVVTDARFMRTAIDRFVYARLAAAGLSPAPPAEPATWLRRVSFDLIGLPPSPAELAAFEADPSRSARAAAVDRLLASPHFGERWARHWMDLFRYSETMGHEFDFDILGAWRYRDWLIRAFEDDLPYDRFILEHLAGDLLLDPRHDPESGLPISAIGTTGLLLGEQSHSPIDTKVSESNRIDNILDVASKAFLGITLACARCHDHKFDPIPTTDYYSGYGLLASAAEVTRVLEPRGSAASHARLTAATDRLRELAIAKFDFDSTSTFATDPGARRLPIPSTRGDRVVADAADPSSRLWPCDGPAFRDAHLSDALLAHPLEELQVELVPWPGAFVHSALRSKRECGSLITPDFRIDKRWLHIYAAGRGARINVILDGFRLVRGPIYDALKQELKSDTPRWIRIDLEIAQGRRGCLELMDLPAPDPADTMHGGGWDPLGWLAFGCAVLSDHEAPPELDAARARGPQLAESLADARVSATPDDVLGVAIAAWHAAEGALPTPVFVTTLGEGNAVIESVHIRGGVRDLGEPVPHRGLTALGASAYDGPGHGRLAWARDIARADNPLTARVAVNRVWHHLLGRGLVATVDNFGKLGEAPTHPELLDWLALRFLDDGWSIKQTIRRIVLTETYGMASRHDDPANAARALAIDPTDSLLHRARLRRLEGEAIRDAMLALSGRLDPTRFGPSVPVHLTPFMNGRGRPGRSGPLDGAGRRSLYLEVRRNFLDPFFLAFDTPIPFSTVGARSNSNVPGQALALLNDPFVQEQARLWAARIYGDDARSVSDRVEQMYRAAFARHPSPDEQSTALTFLGDGSDPAAWQDFAHVLVNVKDFVFLE